MCLQINQKLKMDKGQEVNFNERTRTRSSNNEHLFICHRYGPVFLDFSPRRVMLSGWVGDQDPTFAGLTEALKRYLQSAWAGELSMNVPISTVEMYMLPCFLLYRLCQLWFRYRWIPEWRWNPRPEQGAADPLGTVRRLLSIDGEWGKQGAQTMGV